MPSLFAALEDDLSSAVDAMFGEEFSFIPMTQVTVNSRPGPDGSRSGHTFQAVIDDRNPGSSGFERLGKTSGGSASKGGPPQMTTSNPMLFFDGACFSEPPRRLDRVRRSDTGDVYEITAIEKDGQGRLKTSLYKVAKD